MSGPPPIPKRLVVEGRRPSRVDKAPALIVRWLTRLVLIGVPIAVMITAFSLTTQALAARDQRLNHPLVWGQFQGEHCIEDGDRMDSACTWYGTWKSDDGRYRVDDLALKGDASDDGQARAGAYLDDGGRPTQGQVYTDDSLQTREPLLWGGAAVGLVATASCLAFAWRSFGPGQKRRSSQSPGQVADPWGASGPHGFPAYDVQLPEPKTYRATSETGAAPGQITQPSRPPAGGRRSPRSRPSSGGGHWIRPQR